jgi:hypothetical protein
MLKRYIITLCVALSIAIPCNANKDFSLTPCLMKTVSIRSNNNIKQLELIGVPWSNYSRGLIKFNLKSIDYRRFGKVKKATLSFSVIKNNNPSNLPCNIAMLKTSWNSKASWRSPTEKSKWLSKRRYSNIDYSCSSKNQISSVISPKVKQVKFDITNMIDAWLYQGIQNHGIMLRIGKTVFGKPDIGKWNVVLTNPVLKVEMTGTPPSPSDLKSQTLRFFPSALLPPVRVPYIFLVFSGPDFNFPGSVLNTGSNKTFFPSNGKLGLQWFFGPQCQYWKTPQTVIDNYEKVANNPAILGIHIDEWQSKKVHQMRIKASIEGIIAMKKLKPELYTLVYWRGEDTIKPLTEYKLPDLLVIEVYSHLRKKLKWGPVDFKSGKKRLNLARKYGMIEQTIVLLGEFFPASELKQTWTLKTLENEVKTYRQIAPEAPGMGIYNSNGDEKMTRAADKYFRKYFVAPAPEVTISAPLMQALITFPHVEIIAKAKSKNSAKVIRYDWFIDNRLVAKTKDNKYIWDVRGVQPGKHFITVHAIDSGWNRGAAQITVTVKALSTQAIKR